MTNKPDAVIFTCPMQEISYGCIQYVCIPQYCIQYKRNVKRIISLPYPYQAICNIHIPFTAYSTFHQRFYTTIVVYLSFLAQPNDSTIENSFEIYYTLLSNSNSVCIERWIMPMAKWDGRIPKNYQVLTVVMVKASCHFRLPAKMHMINYTRHVLALIFFLSIRRSWIYGITHSHRRDKRKSIRRTTTQNTVTNTTTTTNF